MKKKNTKLTILLTTIFILSSVFLTGCTKDEDDTLVSIGDDTGTELELEREVEEKFEEPYELVDREETVDKEEIDAEADGERDVENETRESVNFGSDSQVLEGGTSADGVMVGGYNFGVEGNMFKFKWTVMGTEANPIPKVQAKHDSDGNIVVVFPDIANDHTATEEKDTPIDGVVNNIYWNREGNESTYRFSLKEKRDFNLKSTLNPNEVILEINLY